MSEPTFTQIAELFHLGGGPVEEGSAEPDREGRNADESSAMGKARLEEGQYQQAILHFKRAIEQREESRPEDLENLASAYAYGDAAPEALRQFERAKRVHAESSEPLVGLAEIHRQYGHHRQAIQDMEEAIAREPHNAFLHIKLAEMLADAGYPKRGYVAALQAIVQKPDEAYYHSQAGELAAKIGDLTASLGSFRAAIELSPGDDFLYVRAASVFWRLGRKAEAVKAMRLASDLDPEKDRYRGILSVFLLESGLAEEAALEKEAADGLDRYDRDWVSRYLNEAGLTEHAEDFAE